VLITPNGVLSIVFAPEPVNRSKSRTRNDPLNGYERQVEQSALLKKDAEQAIPGLAPSERGPRPANNLMLPAFSGALLHKVAQIQPIGRLPPTE